MKRTLVCLILGCSLLSPAQELPARLGDSVNVQRLLKFSGNLADRQHSVSLHFTMYNEPYGGTAYWQETQNVHPDALGRYTVLLGENTPGGLSADVFANNGTHWLAVQSSGEPEQPRILLVELPSALKSDPIRSSASVSASALQPGGTERYITLLLFMMFLVGMALAYLEALKWWKKRLDRYGPPPLARLLRSMPSRDRLRRAGIVIRFPLADGLRAIRGRLRHSIQSVDHSMQSIEDEPPTKAA